MKNCLTAVCLSFLISNASSNNAWSQDSYEHKERGQPIAFTRGPGTQQELNNFSMLEDTAIQDRKGALPQGQKWVALGWLLFLGSSVISRVRKNHRSRYCTGNKGGKSKMRKIKEFLLFLPSFFQKGSLALDGAFSLSSPTSGSSTAKHCSLDVTSEEFIKSLSPEEWIAK